MKTHIQAHKYRVRKRERGQSLVEFALLAPVLLILFMGMFDFGWILHQQIQMDNAARLGARQGAVGDSNIDIIRRMREVMSFSQEGVQIQIDVRNSSGVSIGNPADRTPDNIIFVSIIRNNVPLVTPLGGLVNNLAPVRLRSTAQFLIE